MSSTIPQVYELFVAVIEGDNPTPTIFRVIGWTSVGSSIDPTETEPAIPLVVSLTEQASPYAGPVTLQGGAYGYGTTVVEAMKAVAAGDARQLRAA